MKRLGRLATIGCLLSGILFLMASLDPNAVESDIPLEVPGYLMLSIGMLRAVSDSK